MILDSPFILSLDVPCWNECQVNIDSCGLQKSKNTMTTTVIMLFNLGHKSLK